MESERNVWIADVAQWMTTIGQIGQHEAHRTHALGKASKLFDLGINFGP
jgi:hypothetical protein